MPELPADPPPLTAVPHRSPHTVQHLKPVSGGPKRLIIHTDGSAIGNPGPAGIGFIFHDDTGNKIFEASRAIGHATNNVAEYRALIAALEEARARGAEGVAVQSDSELMVRQMTGEYRVKHPDLKPLFAQAQALASAFAEFSIAHVRREGNRGADRLAFNATEAPPVS
ncbi:MAG: ribonuclease HI family protein [Planctomycetota bacterium]